MFWILLIVAVAGAGQMIPNAVTVGVIFVATLWRFVQMVDRRPAILELAAIVAVLQFLVASVAMYSLGNWHQKYHMYVDEVTYFSYAIPATCCFLIGLFAALPGSTINFRLPVAQPKLNSLGELLVVVGFLCSMAASYIPSQLQFVFYLLSQLRYVGILYLYFNRSSKFLLAAVAVGLSLALQATRDGMFHELLIWGALMSAFYFLANRPSMKLKVGFLVVAFCAVSLIQLVKHEYRELLWSGKRPSFTGVLLNSLQREDPFGTEWQQGMVIRLNQGWIVSAVMRHVPSNVSFAEGETIKEAIVASLIPRILNSNKKMADSSINTELYTGLDIYGNTSMGLGPLGEGYANFGSAGGCGVMVCFGLLLNGVYKLFIRLGWNNQYFLFVIPLVFLQAIKMETEFLSVFNHVVKSCTLVFGHEA
ncbi:MAG: hypothetical protein ACKVHE_29195 [Planctomycetales bacterium]